MSILEGVTLERQLGTLGGLNVYRATQQTDGGDKPRQFTAVVVSDHADSRQVRTLPHLVQAAFRGGLDIERSDEHAVLATPAPTGTLADLGALGWRLTERLGVFVELAERVEAYHQDGLVAGPFAPAQVFLDEDFHPFLLGPWSLHGDPAYIAPETVQGGLPDLRSDVYSLGRILHFVLTGKVPPQLQDALAKLNELSTYPAGLGRIVRKACHRSASQRYANVQEMLTDVAVYGRYDQVGLAHPDAVELNLSGISYRPGVATSFRPSAVPPKPGQLSRPSMAPADVSNMLASPLKQFKLNSQVRVGLLVAAGLVALGALGASYFVGAGLPVRIALGIGCGLLGFSIFSPGMERELTLRSVFFVFGLLAAVVTHPASAVAAIGKEARLNSGTTEARAKALQELNAAGHIKYSGVDLAGADLSKQSFLFVQFDGASLKGANLSESNFLQTNLSGTNFKDANIKGAVFQSTEVEKALNFDLAKCDGKTVFPPGWSCVSGSPKVGGSE